ncbi:MAG: hypothetical protein H8E48_04555 [Chloroflexi bacterium]|nr:hypothetical protein [Chloroflexota bacterium]MBL6838005.1 hypothetical protein [Puniceicoccaceae bacterium]
MKQTRVYISILLACVVCTSAVHGAEGWRIDTTEEWQAAEQESGGLVLGSGLATPTNPSCFYRSITRTFSKQHSAASFVITQSPEWHNWNPIDNIGPSNLKDAPVFLSTGPDDYWMFGRYGPSEDSEFTAESIQLEGFDIPLKSTPFPNQFDAPGGLRKGLGGYHAWQSRDMLNWVHHGPVTEKFSRWVTTAEYVDGKAYIYYDYPNDQDPHLYIDDDLTDGKPGRNVGLAFKDPSDGSDCAVIRDLQGRFHVIYEDWSPINARNHSWDSPLGGHAVSKNGTGNFTILPPAVDERTKPTGKVAEYLHPHWKQHPDWDSNVARYNVHEPEQNAYGDWSAICIGEQYYLFCDFHPAHDGIRVGWFTSSSLDKPFSFCGEIGRGHPDPDILFAEGRFYLVTQMKKDYSSPGPWVEKVEARVGVDTDGDTTIDVWTDWREVKERYNYIKGFSKQVERVPASIDVSELPAGFGFCFDLRAEDATKNKSKPILDSVHMAFEN